MIDSDNMLAVLDGFVLNNAGDIAMAVAQDLRRRRVEKDITRRQLAAQSGVPLASIARFEREGKISFDGLIRLAMALGYVSEIKSMFSQPKYDTIEELDQIRRNMNKKKATGR